MNNRPEITFTLPACMGGVAAFNYNIINHSGLIKDFFSRVVLLKAREDTRPLFLDSFLADEVATFSFSYKENQSHVYSRLSKLLGQGEGALVTDNMLTINAAKLSANPKTVYHLIHDFFYVGQNLQAGDLVDVAISHSSFFSDAVFASDPELFFNRSFYIPYGVEQLAAFPEKNSSELNLVFLGRLDEGKGVMKLHNIDDRLNQQGIRVNWTIIGKGPLKESLRQQWRGNPNVSFHEPDSTQEIYGLLKEQDLFIFPTIFEGTPVSILECLANGVVTITNDLPGGIRDIITENIGRRCELNNIDQFTGYIAMHHNDRPGLRKMQKNCFELGQSRYDISKNADKYFDKFLQFRQLKRDKKRGNVKMSRLDNRLFPNGLVKFLRNIRK